MDSRDSEEGLWPAGLCATCRNLRVITSHKGNIYYLCGLAAVDNRYAKYPTLPVIDCAGFLPHPLDCG